MLVYLSNILISILQKLGNGLGGAIRTQVNIQINAVPGVKAAEGLRDILLPVMWISSEVHDINDPDLLKTIKDRL